MKILISGSIVLYKTNILVINAINNFLNTTLPVKLFLIDNSPSDQLRSELADLLTDNRIEYTFNNNNVGFGVGHNTAIRKVINISSYHLVLNPDVSFDKGVLESLAQYMEKNKQAGLVMPKVLYPNGALQYACKLLPSPGDLIFRRFIPSGFTKKRNEVFEMRGTYYSKEMEVPYLSGCFMFLRTSALKKVGLFDERFFMYPEDIDLTRRINREYKTMYYPHASIVHAHAQGSYKSLKLLYIHIINMIRYFNKWGWFFDKERKEVNKRILAQFK